MNPLDEPLSRSELIFVPVWPTVFKYALIGSAAIIFFSVISFSTGINGRMYNGSSMVSIMGSMAISFMTFIAYVLIMIFSIREYKKHTGGYTSLGNAMLVSYIPGLIMAIVGIIASLTYLFVINPSYINETVGEFARVGGANQEEVYKSMILATTGMYFVGGCVVGIVLSLIISAIMKKDYPYNSY